MKILTRIFAAIGFMVVASLLISFVAGLLWGTNAPSIPDRAALVIDFSHPVVEAAAADPLAMTLGDRTVTLQGLVAAIDRAGSDERIRMLVADVSDVSLPPAQIEEVRAAVRRFRETGKPAYAYADSFGEMGPGNRNYWLAAAFGKIWLQPLGNLGLTGAGMSLPFARTALDRLGIFPDIRQRYEYKGAADTLTARTMPTPSRANYQRLLDDIHGNMVADISTDRRIQPARLRRLIDQAPLSGSAALEAGLIDTLGYRDEFNVQELGGMPTLDVADYLFALEIPEEKPAARVALIYVNGAIVRREDEAGLPGTDGTASAEVLVKAINAAAGDEAVKAIVLRLDTPGGSVTASEAIYRAVQQARDKGRFVVVSMGGVAASGGYWIAAAADRIVANPSTITGSIGVVGGKFVIGPLSEKLGINWTELTTGANSDMLSPARPFSPGAAARVDASLDAVYRAFTDRVATGRSLKPAQLDAVARGRVWSGQRAREMGLVDELGGLREAFQLVRTNLALAESAPLEVVQLPAPETAATRVLSLLRQFIAAPALPMLVWSGLLQAAGLPGHPGAVLSPTGSVLYSGPQMVE